MLPGGGGPVEVARPASVAAAVVSTPIPHRPDPLLPVFEISRESLSSRLRGERTREVLPFEPHRLVSGHSESVRTPPPVWGWLEPRGRGSAWARAQEIG